MEDVLKSGYYEFLLGYNNVEWFVDEVIKLESKKDLYCKKNNNKCIILTEEDEQHYRNSNICRFCGKTSESDKVKGHCQLTGK